MSAVASEKVRVRAVRVAGRGVANPANESYIRLVRILPPANTKWEPGRAQQLMVSLFAIDTPLKLVLQVSGSRLEWCIEVPRGHQTAVVQSLYASYPKAQVQVRSKQCVSSSHYAYSFHAAVPFIGPLRYVQEFGRLDPLATLLSATTSVAPGEEMSYELQLRRMRSEYYELGKRLSTESTVRWWSFLTLHGAIAAAVAKASGTDKRQRFVPPLQRLVEEKLAAPLKEASLEVRIRAGTRTRASELAALLNPSLALFGRPSCNFLVPAQPESFPLALSPPEAAALWHLPSDQCQTQGIAWATSVSAPVPAAIASKRQGICLGTNIYQGRSTPVWLANVDRVTHITIFGKTGSGKSTELHHMINQDVQSGRPVGLIDKHGDLVDQTASGSIPERRERDVLLFDMGDTDYPIGLNFFAAPANVSPDIVAGRNLAVIRKMFADQWSPTRMEDALHAALMALQFVEGSTILDVARLFLDSSFRAQVLASVRDPVALEFWLDEYEPLSASHQREFARPITNRLRKFYRNPRIRRVVGQVGCPDFRALIDRGKLVLANLSGISEVDAETLGALLVSKFEMAGMSRMDLARGDRSPYYLYIDEAHSLKTSSLDVLYSEARKTGLSIVTVSQFMGQLEGATLDAIMGNVGTTVIFPVGPKDANALASFVRPQFTSDDLVNLSRFNAVVKMQRDGATQPAFSIRIPAPLALPPDADERLERIRTLSRRRYARHKDEVDAEILAKYTRYGQVAVPDCEDIAEEDYFG